MPNLQDRTGCWDSSLGKTMRRPTMGRNVHVVKNGDRWVVKEEGRMPPFQPTSHRNLRARTPFRQRRKMNPRLFFMGGMGKSGTRTAMATIRILHRTRCTRVFGILKAYQAHKRACNLQCCKLQVCKFMKPCAADWSGGTTVRLRGTH